MTLHALSEKDLRAIVGRPRQVEGIVFGMLEGVFDCGKTVMG